MSLILNIDTALERASVCLAKDDLILETTFSENQKDHAAWLHPAIQELLKKNNLPVHDLDAIAVSIGPGSYTGLRVSLSAAKGFCYALNIPLITVSTLHMLAFAVQQEAADLIIPAIDARRMEIYTAVYEKTLEEMTPPHALIADENSFNELLKNRKVLFCGNAIGKLQTILKNPNAFFSETMSDAGTLAEITFELYRQKIFADLAYAEPLYLKDFYSPSFKK
ncbi:MAG TPA: tRNA (adenosine(37)-N6)-threonylcarbamoyltransferase complex dimerization subunit type 1 TsaB [Chitinophagaceae bacterium]|nr:tRNA (adenosine(37)-N6)-threonylcarbamoyltransferase complex dimerization subunit type 1 TsaB [Chitinophagaceae bacterium]